LRFAKVNAWARLQVIGTSVVLRGPQFVHGYLLRPAYDLLLALPYTLLSMERGSDCSSMAG
jgi:hypothetical protein